MDVETFKKTLDAARYSTVKQSPHPFYLVQLSHKKELELKGALVSDALAWLLDQEEYSHVFLQTHGWNTPADAAVRSPFSEFMAGMQDDRTMPTDEIFKPLFVAFTWETLPLKFILEKDALTRDELLKEDLQERGREDIVVTSVTSSVARAAKGEENIEAVRENLKRLVEESREGLDEGEIKDTDIDAIVDQTLQVNEQENGITERGIVSNLGGRLVTRLLDPIQRLVFGRLINRGVKTGEVLRSIITKFMHVRRAKYCLMANSLGAHVIGGALKERGDLPFRLHTAFTVQGACNRNWYGSNGRYKEIVQQVAGPVVCSLSDKDTMLSRVFEPFHGDAVGNFGFVSGNRLEMRAKDDLSAKPYTWSNGNWNSVDGSKYIDEGDALSGGHGDFMEDETTMMYWSAINETLPDEKYHFSTDMESPQDLLGQVLSVTPLGKLFK